MIFFEVDNLEVDSADLSVHGFESTNLEQVFNPSRLHIRPEHNE